MICIIDNSYTLAQQIEDSGKLKESNYRQEGALLCKLWMAYNWSADEIRKGLYKRVDSLYPMISEQAKLHDVSIMYSMATNMPPLRKECISFSQEEIAYIHSLDNVQAERILFAILYLYKKRGGEFKMVKAELKKVACVNWNPNTIQSYMTYLIQNGYVKSRIFRSKLLYSVNDALASLYNEDNKCIEVSAEKNIAYYYLNQIGYGKYFYCSRCGCIDDAVGHGKCCCKQCAKIINIEKTKDRKAKRFETAN